MTAFRLSTVPLATSVAVLLLFIPLSAWSQCSGNCYPPQYDTDANWPWAPTANVKVDFDPGGQLGSGNGDSKPKFTLTSSNEQAWFNGASKWQQQGQGNEVTMTEAQSSGPDVLIVTTAWPSATITWTDSSGYTETETLTVCDPSKQSGDPCAPTSHVGAATIMRPDHTINSQGKRVTLPYAAIAVTFINTNGT